MKKIIYPIVLFFLSISVYSQTAINTNSPLGIFHVDTNGDSNSVTNLKDDFIVGSDGSNGSGVSVTLGGEINPSTSISLNEPNKGFLLNRVALVSSLGNDKSNPIKNPIDGMLVYNTNAVGTPPNNVIEGPYIYNANQGLWLQLNFIGTGVDVSTFQLASQINVPQLASVYSADGFLANGKALPLINGNTGFNSETITLNSDAAYGVAINMVATTSGNSTTTTQGHFYIAAVHYPSGSTTGELLDIAGFLPTIGPNNNTTAYSTIFGFNAAAGDEVKILIIQATGASFSMQLSPATTVTLWRL